MSNKSLPRGLNSRQYYGLQKIGDCMIPGDADLPRFSDSGCALQVDRILDYMPAGDLGDLKKLLGVFSLMPKFMIAGLLCFLEVAAFLPIMRMIRLGLRGLVMTLYYADPKHLRVMNYELNVYLE